MKVNEEHYEAITGLKAYSIIGIIMMHVLGEGAYSINGFIFEKLIPSFTNLVFLFMMLSGFGMCCGYYYKIIKNKITIEDFYMKRYAKIWPYFALLCGLDFVISPSKNSLYEVFANLTLCQGFIPNSNISVIGVSWTLAVIFVFYIVFPFFCFLLANRKRAWLVFVSALILNYLCFSYFKIGRLNFIYDAVFFVVGGLVYLYREEITFFVRKHRIMVFMSLLGAVGFYYIVGFSTMSVLLVCFFFLIYAMGCQKKGILINRIIRFIGNICFEIYLCHMVIYRILEQMHIIHLFANELLSFVLVFCCTLIGSIVFSLVLRLILKKIKKMLDTIRRNIHSIKSEVVNGTKSK